MPNYTEEEVAEAWNRALKGRSIGGSFDSYAYQVFLSELRKLRNENERRRNIQRKYRPKY